MGKNIDYRNLAEFSLFFYGINHIAKNSGLPQIFIKKLCEAEDTIDRSPKLLIYETLEV